MVVLFIALYQMEDDFNFPVSDNIYSDHMNNMNNVCLLAFLNCEVTVFPLAIHKTFVGRALNYAIITSVSKLSLYLSTYLTADSWVSFLFKGYNPKYLFLLKCHPISPMDALISILRFWLGLSSCEDTLVIPNTPCGHPFHSLFGLWCSSPRWPFTRMPTLLCHDFWYSQFLNLA